jgi:hypothetical protein
MEVNMNIEVVELIQKANKIISATGKSSGTKYPKSLKKIVVSLRNEHNISIRDLIKHIPISAYSAREWPRKHIEKSSFNKVSVKDAQLKVNVKKIPKHMKQFELIIFNQRLLIVLITLLIFQSLAFHLFL